MKELISIIQIILGVLLVLLVILQSKGSGLGSTFGGDFSFYSSKRGAEKMIFITTIIVAFLFLLTSVLGVMI